MGLTQLLFHKGVENHRTVLVNISTSSAIGKFERRVVPPKVRRLGTKNENSVKAYLRFITTECQRHQLQRRLDNITRDLQTRPVSPSHHKQLENIDVQRSNTQQGGKHRCRKIVKPLLSFSPPIRGIDMRRRAYVNLVAWHEKEKSSGDNIFKKAWKAGINNPRALTLQECLAGIKTCKQLMKEQADQAKQLQREHLRNRYD
jgi:hypothetical protein